MPTDFEEMKQQLLQSNDEFRQLATQHHDLDERIHNFADRALPLRTRTNRRSHPEEKETPAEGPDGEHAAATHRRRRTDARRAALTRSAASISSRGPAPDRVPSARTGPGPLLCTAFFRYENRSGRSPVHRAARWCPAALAAVARRHGWATGFAALGGFFDLFLPRSRTRRSRPDPGLVVSPADGRVVIAGPDRPALEPARGTGSRSRSSCRRWTCT